MISFKHFSNKYDIGITSWGEVKDMVLTIMNCIYKYQIDHVTFKKMVEALRNIASSSSLQSKMVGLEREERFRTCKQKFGNPLGFARDSH
jgi:hypothetical protein